MDELYLRWIMHKVGCESVTMYADLMFSTPFVSLIEMDNNRDLDGIELRGDYIWETHKHPISEIEDHASVLEVLVALALRMEDLSQKYDAAYFFDMMMDNMGFHEEELYWDQIDFNIQRFVNRAYNADGSGGGLFVIPGFPKDMRRMQLFDQCTEFLNYWETHEDI